MEHAAVAEDNGVTAPDRNVKERKMRIGLFIPCYIDAFFPEVGIATLELLERLGHEVVYPRDQTWLRTADGQ